MTPADALNKTGVEARDGRDTDAVGGVRPAYVAFPATVEETAAVMRAADEHDLAVVPRGAGTKIDWGIAPYRCDLVLDLSRMREVVEHAAGDLVVRVEAGCPMDDLAAVLADKNQRLALDTPVPGATVGGTLATATSGPLRLAYGTARDLLIGVTMVRADGAVASSGGRVVKNVAGYDLGKLLTGALGTLGVIVSATFRLHPVPSRRAYVRAAVAGPDGAHAATQAVLGAQAVPSAIEYERTGRGGGAYVTVLLEGGADVPARAEEVAERLNDAANPSARPAETAGRPGGAEVAGRAAGAGAPLGGGVETGEAPPAGFGAYPGEPGGTLIKLIAPVADLPYVLTALDAAAEATGLDPAVRGSGGVGVLYAALPAGAPPDDVGAFLAALRGALASRDGSAVVLHAGPDVREVVGMWGPVAGLGLMRRVKERFDPGHRLSPGRFAGGI